MKNKRILVLCTGNSCRSQIAEGYFRYYGSDRYDVYSAGTEPDILNKHAVHCMKEDGVDISSQKSKNVADFHGKRFDYIITVCGNAKEKCPVFPGSSEKIHWPIEDPSAFHGTDEEKLRKFILVRDEIKRRVKEFLS